MEKGLHAMAFEKHGRSEGVNIFLFAFKVYVDGLYPSLNKILVGTVQDPEIR